MEWSFHSNQPIYTQLIEPADAGDSLGRVSDGR